ncbi:MAG: phenylalanine--tRNA ligase subunit beta [Chitinophagaceae bacterium]|nr:MAG: phenylalanine--tRNA ligase subunit beta [Chitinophagaceae bacterium]
MTISYKWLSEYLPVTLEPERLSRILTSIGLEVESLVKYEEAKGGLKGLVIGEVLTTEKHPNADKLTLTTVNVGTDTPLQIVCGAPNVAAGQKVVVAPVGATIYPTTGEPLTMRVAKIRSIESHGMICAEDEIGLGDSHAGIMVLPGDARVGQTASDYFHPYEDYIYEIGLTPNRMDAMSHWGVARDVCAYLSHHDKKDTRAKIPNSNSFRADNHELPVEVKVENEKACPRYSGLSISNITVGDSPKWLQQRLKSIGLRPINNIVDITNYIQHETGQPLHAFDADRIAGKKVIVKNLPEGTVFTTLDDKQRKLSADDLMICDENEGMCIAGVFGGIKSGVTDATKNIFLESACFDGITIRKTSFRHGLRTDAATRFEKGTDISATVNVLKRAALLIREICGGEISSDVIDIYPDKRDKEEVAIKYHYLKKLSGKNYHPDAVKNILTSLGFEVLKEGIDELRVAVPYHKTDISLPADLVEEVLRIDGLDNVAIPDSITITPSVEDNYVTDSFREKAANYLVGLGFYEIMTNSITNSAFFSETELANSVKMLNSLSAELDLMRPSMLETGLVSIAHNLNRRNNDLRFFEYGKTYSTDAPGSYQEKEHLCLYVTGRTGEEGWRDKPAVSDFYVLKGIIGRIFELLGVRPGSFETLEHPKMESGLQGVAGGEILFQAGLVHKKTLSRFDIKQPVWFADFNWTAIAALAAAKKPGVTEIPKYPAVQRDLALVVSSEVLYAQLETAVKKIKPVQLTQVRLFDVFESEKLGTDKKSLAVSFTFQDVEKTLTDKEIDGWMTKIMNTLEKELSAEIRK